MSKKRVVAFFMAVFMLVNPSELASVYAAPITVDNQQIEEVISVEEYQQDEEEHSIAAGEYNYNKDSKQEDSSVIENKQETDNSSNNIEESPVETVEESEDKPVEALRSTATSGECGINGGSATWAVTDENGDGIYETLTIEGTGEIEGFSGEYWESTYYDHYMWGYYRSSITTIVVGEGITHLPNEFAYMMKKLTSVSLPSTLVEIGDTAFNRCSSLQAITLPENLQVIGAGAFFYDSQLQSIKIPGSVTSIGRNAFDGCTNLTSVYATSLDHWMSLDFSESGNPLENGAHLYFGEEELTELVIPAGTTAIGAHAFDGAKYITSLTMPDSVINIGACAFNSCSGLTELSLPKDLVSVGVNAFAGCSGLTKLYVDSMEHYLTIDFSGNSPISLAKNLYVNGELVTTVKVPASITEIKDKSFYNATITGVDFSESNVTQIGQYAFYYTNISEVNLANSKVTEIGTGAFQKCYKLTSVDISNCNIASIEAGTFSGDSSLTSFKGTNALTSIGNSAFDDCAKLSEITYNEGLVSIGAYAFDGCGALVKFVTPSTLTTIGNAAFRGCNGLKEIVLGDNITSLGSEVFARCYGIENLTLSTNIQSSYLYSSSSSDSVFYNCYAYNITFTGTGIAEVPPQLRSKYYLKKVTINDGVIGIGAKAFSGCELITSIDIPNSVKTIGDCAFKNCCGLTSVNMPKNLTDMGESAFYNCKGLTSFVIPEGIVTIKKDTFYGCSGIKDITLPSTYRNCEENAFSGIEYTGGNNAKSIDYARVTSADSWLLMDFPVITKHVYVGDELLTSVTCPEGLTKLRRCAFANNTDITSITLNEGMESIEDYALMGASNITGLSIPSTVTYIGNSALYKYSGTSLVLPEGLTYIGAGALKNSKITSLVIPDGIKEIPDSLLENCYYLESLSFANDVSSFGTAAFKYCQKLTSINIPEGITEIKAQTFSYMGAHDYQLPEGVTSIGESAFDHAGYDIYSSAYIRINFPESLTSIGTGAFLGTSISNGTFKSLSQFFNINYGDQYANPMYRGTLYAGDNYIRKTVTVPEDVTSLKPYSTWYFSTVFIPDTVTSIESKAITTGNQIVFTGSATGLSLGDNWIYYQNKETEANSAGLIIYTPEGDKSWNTIIGNNKQPWWMKGTPAINDAKIIEGANKNVVYQYNSDVMYCYGNGSGVMSKADYYSAVDRYNYSNHYSGWTSKKIIVGAGIKKIDEYALGAYSKNYYNDTVEEIIIADTVESLGKGVFFNSRKLTKVTLPKNLNWLYENSFSGCTSIEEIFLPESMWDIESKVFENCTALKKVFFTRKTGSHSLKIAADAFTGVTATVYYDDATTLSNSAKAQYGGTLTWKGTTNVDGHYFDHDTYERNDDATCSTNETETTYCLLNCGEAVTREIANSKISTRHHFGNTMVDLGNGNIISYCDYGCGTTEDEISGSVLQSGTTNGLTWEVRGKVLYIIGNGTTANYDVDNPAPWKSLDICAVMLRGSVNIGTSAFEDMTGIKSVTFGEGAYTIGKYAFYGCSGLTSVKLPKSISSVDVSAFEGCTNLSKLEADGNLKTVGTNAFKGCDKLTICAYDGMYIIDYAKEKGIAYETLGLYGEENDVLHWYYAEDTLRIIGNGSMGTYTYDKKPGWINLTPKKVILEGVVTISDYAFYGMTSIESIQGTESLYVPGYATIGKYAFYGCNGLTRIAFPSHAIEVSESCFENCLNLQRVDNLSNVVSVGNNAFRNCPKLDTLSFNKTVLNSVGDNAFRGDSALVSANFMENVSSLGTYVFADCGNLSSVKLYSKATVIPEGSFLNCSSLASNPVTSGITTIGAYAFENTAINSITFYEALNTIGDRAFAGCKITGITISASMTTFNASAFAGCKSLATIQVEEGNTVFAAKDNILKSADGTVIYLYAPAKTDESYTIGSTVRKIAPGAFEGAKLKTLNIREGLTTIDAYAFKDMAITDISLPASLTTIDPTAFTGCTKLTNIEVSEDNSYFAVAEGLLTNKEKNTLILCPGSLMEVSIPASITSVESGAFMGLADGARINLPFEFAGFNGNPTLPEGVKLKGYSNSYAYYMACDKDLPFESLGVYELEWDNYRTHCMLAFKEVKEALLKRSNYTYSDGNFTMKYNESYDTIYFKYSRSWSNTGGTEYVSFSIGPVIPEGFYTDYYYYHNDIDGSGKYIVTGSLHCSRNSFDQSVSENWNPSANAAWQEVVNRNGGNLNSHNNTANNLMTLLLNSADRAVRAMVGNYFYMTDLGYTSRQPAVTTGSIHFNSKETGAVSADCTNDGNKANLECQICGAKKSGDTIPAKGHNVETTVTPATLETDGSIVVACKDCGDEVSRQTIKRLAAPTITEQTFAYTGAIIDNVGLVVADADGNAIDKTYYTVTRDDDNSQLTSVGHRSLTVTYSGNYSGEYTLNFDVLPDSASNALVSNVDDGIQLTWTAASGANYYKISRKSQDEDKYTDIGTCQGTSYIDNDVEVDKLYHYCILAVGLEGETTYESEDVATCSLTREVELKGIRLNSTSKTITEEEYVELLVSGYPVGAKITDTVEWTSSDDTIATVDNQGKVTAIKPGVITITAKAGKLSDSCQVTITNAVKTITFMLDQTTEYKTIEVIKGQSPDMTDVVNPKKSGFKFAGWFKGENKLDSAKPVTENLTYYAQWEDLGKVQVYSNYDDNKELPNHAQVILSAKAEVDASDVDANIYYCIGGEEALTEDSGTLYTGPISLDLADGVEADTLVIRAIAVHEEYATDNEQRFTYHVTNNMEGLGDIAPEDLPNTDEYKNQIWVAGLDSVYTYTGTAIKPAIRVYDGTRLLKLKTDYTLTYGVDSNKKVVNRNNINVGIGVITINGTGGYNLSKSFYFDIKAKSLQDEDISCADIIVMENGRVQKSAPQVYWNKRKLTKNDYLVDYGTKEFISPGVYQIAITGKGNYQGTITITETILKKNVQSFASGLAVSGVKALTFDQVQTILSETPQGEVPKLQNLVIKRAGKTLTENVDYRISYENYDSVGTATMVIEGLGNIVGTKRVTFAIKGRPISKCKLADRSYEDMWMPITKLPDQTYIPGQTEYTYSNLGLTYQENARAAVERLDSKAYQISYANNTKAGTATVIFTANPAMGYTGVLKKTFKITQCKYLDTTSKNKPVVPEEYALGISYSEEVPYCKGGAMPEVKVTLGNVELIKNIDYTVSYGKNKKVTPENALTNALPTITIKGKGNYAGTSVRTFTIYHKALNEADIYGARPTIVAADVLGGKAGSYLTKPVITDTDGKKLVGGTDFLTNYTYYADINGDGVLDLESEIITDKRAIIPAGTLCRVVVQAKGNYQGYIEADYYTTYASLKSCKLDKQNLIADKTYTGNAIEIDKAEIHLIDSYGNIVDANDFEIISYKNNIKPGTASLVIEGRGGKYFGTSTLTFKIVKKNINY